MSLLSTRPAAVCLLFTTEREVLKAAIWGQHAGWLPNNFKWCGIMWNLSVEPWILPLRSRTWTRFQQGRRRLKGRKFNFNTCLMIVPYSVVLQYLWLSGRKKLQPAPVWILVRPKYILTMRWCHFHLSQRVSQRAYLCSLLTQISYCTSLYILNSL